MESIDSPPYFGRDSVCALANVIGEAAFAVGFHEAHNVVDANRVTSSYRLGGLAAQSFRIVAVTDLGRDI
jgi:hypothetical protein